MRKLALVLAAGLVVGSLATPAAAGKKPVKVHESFGGNLLPLPNLSSHTGTEKPGCSAGQEGVHWVGQEFTSPGKGTLRLYMEGFTGDHDLYVFQDDVKVAESVQEQVSESPAPAEEEILIGLKKGQKVLLVACNWAGQPQVEAHYEGTFK